MVRGGWPALWAVGAAFFVAELDATTMLATITLAPKHGWFGTWIGSTAGMVLPTRWPSWLADGWGAACGSGRFGTARPPLFVVFGVWLVVDAIGQLT